MKQLAMTLLILLSISLVLLAQDSKRVLNLDDILACKRLGALALSPDAKKVAFTVTWVNEKENSMHTEIYVMNNDGSGLKQITDNEKSSRSPKWSPKGDKLAYIHDGQIWTVDKNLENPTQVTSHYSGAGSFEWAPNGNLIAFESRVYADAESQEEIKKRDEEKENSKIKARVYEDLLFRHWNEYWDYKRTHLFVLDLKSKEIKDMTPGDYDAQPIALGSGYCFSPDSKELYFTSNHDEVIATSTNNDIWSVSLNGGEQILVSKTCELRQFKGNDHSPQFSPNGKYLSFLSMDEPGYEADKTDFILLDLKSGTVQNVTEKLEYSIGSYQWMPDNKNILCEVDHTGREKLFLLNIKTGNLTEVNGIGQNRSVNIDPKGKKVYHLHQNFTRPFEIYCTEINPGVSKKLTGFNDDIFANIEQNPGEDFWYEGADSTKVHGFLIKPPFFDAAKKYPTVFMVHGGPQGAWHDGWHFRWNPEIWAAQGYVMVMINPRGSTGYGQKFCEEISRDWGGKVFEDLIKGQQYVLENFSFIDKKNIAAAGASYGGYMMNWMEGHMDAFQYPFKTLVNHDGSFNLYAKYLTTDELWFPEKELGGAFWENNQDYIKFSPHNYVENFKTPMLIIHGELDFRLDYSEGIMPFTALRKKGVDAKLILFPDEDHWVQKPQNSRFWHESIFQWLDSYIK
ncbi:MAG: S9 family peptidase [Candidatus Marinimicrobia bacterium]|nr:S9 family peptidase [Candidatus Neomarinimicrobiota bacterium]